MTWGFFYCPYCQESRRAESDLWAYDGDTIQRTCQKPACKAKEKTAQDQERERREREDEEARQRQEEERIQREINWRRELVELGEEISAAEAKTGQMCHGRKDIGNKAKGTCDQCNYSKILFDTKDWEYRERDPDSPSYQYYFKYCADCYCKKYKKYSPPKPNQNNPSLISKNNFPWLPIIAVGGGLLFLLLIGGAIFKNRKKR